MKTNFLSGSFVALVTPMKGGKVDERALGDLVDWHVKSGTRGLVPCGTTGESPTLTHDEHRSVIQKVIERAAGRVPVVAGTGSNSTEEAVSLTKHAVKAGAQGVLVITPYYNKPTQDGLHAHFARVAEAAGELPVVLYNVPGRTSVDLLPPTVEKLCRNVPNIVAIKEATGNVDRTSELLVLHFDRRHLVPSERRLRLSLSEVDGIREKGPLCLGIQQQTPWRRQHVDVRRQCPVHQELHQCLHMVEPRYDGRRRSAQRRLVLIATPVRSSLLREA